MVKTTFFPKVTKMGSIIWPQNRLQWGNGSERIAAYTQRSRDENADNVKFKCRVWKH